jgi:hypothetical protein
MATTTEAINSRLADSWKANRLKPAERTSDTEFVRRVYLDVIGRVPRVEEVRDFEKDAAVDKRAKLVDRLLASPEYIAFWAEVWTRWLLGDEAPRLARSQMELWLIENGLSKERTSYKQLVEQLLTATGKTNDIGAVNFILAHLGNSTVGTARNARPTPELLAREGQFDMVPITLRTLRLFLGYRLDGLQFAAHHPPECDWQPKHFWSVNGFFRQTERIGGPGMVQKKGMPIAPLTLTDNFDFNKKGIILYVLENGVNLPAEPMFLDGRKLPNGEKKVRREFLAECVTTHTNFAPAFVNRMWGHCFGRGLHEKPQVDDFSSRNKAVHPDLLERLAKDFIAADYDPRALLRSICTSDAYRLQSVVNATNSGSEKDCYFSRMPLKVLNPEQLRRSLLAIAFPDWTAPLTGRVDDGQVVTRERAKFASDLGVPPAGLNGSGEWQDLPVRDQIVWAMRLLNRDEVTAILQSPQVTPLAAALDAKQLDGGAEGLYLSVLSRKPTEREVARIGAEIEKEKKAGNDVLPVWQDVFWALLNSSEFVLNH